MDEVDKDNETRLSNEEIAQARDFDVNALRIAHTDAQRTLDTHLKNFTSLSEKAGRTVRFDAFILTITVSALSLSENPSSFMNFLTIFGFISIFLSFTLGIWAHRSQQIKIGPSEEDFSKLIEYRMRGEEYLRWIINTGYSKWIKDISNINKGRSRILDLAHYLILIGVASLIAGILIAL